MKVLLVDVDSLWGNLALMKLSACHKRKGDQVFLNRVNPKKHYTTATKFPISLWIDSPVQRFDVVHVSCLFDWNRQKALSIAKMFECMGSEVHVGGSGIDLKKALPEEVEHLMPDYSLYGLNFSMGFLTRGCIRKCPWCIVPKKEGMIRFNAPLHEFRHPRHRKVMILDNNLLAYQGHMDLLWSLIGFKVCFNQGLDIRLINDENAKLLSIIDCRDDEFKDARLYFSWDILEIESKVLDGLTVLRNHGIPAGRCLIYMLCGFDVKPERYDWQWFLDHDWHRYETLMKLKAKPFIMVCDNRKDLPLLSAFQRWVNYRFKPRKGRNLG